MHSLATVSDGNAAQIVYPLVDPHAPHATAAGLRCYLHCLALVPFKAPDDSLTVWPRMLGPQPSEPRRSHENSHTDAKVWGQLDDVGAVELSLTREHLRNG